MSAPVRGVCVMVFAKAPDGDARPVEDAYHQVSRTLGDTPGLLGNRLLRSVSDPGSFVVISEWSDLAAFRAWEEGADHREATAPLRPLQSRAHAMTFGVYEVSATYSSTVSDDG